MYPIFPRAGHRAHPCAPRHSAACRRLLLMALCTLPLWTLTACSTLSALQAAAPEQQAAQAGPNLSLLTLPAYTDTDAAAAQPADAAGQTALVDLWLDGTQNMGGVNTIDTVLYPHTGKKYREGGFHYRYGNYTSWYESLLRDFLTAAGDDARVRALRYGNETWPEAALSGLGLTSADPQTAASLWRDLHTVSTQADIRLFAQMTGEDMSQSFYALGAPQWLTRASQLDAAALENPAMAPAMAQAQTAQAQAIADGDTRYVLDPGVNDNNCALLSALPNLDESRLTVITVDPTSLRRLSGADAGGAATGWYEQTLRSLGVFDRGLCVGVLDFQLDYLGQMSTFTTANLSEPLLWGRVILNEKKQTFDHLGVMPRRLITLVIGTRARVNSFIDKLDAAITADRALKGLRGPQNGELTYAANGQTITQQPFTFAWNHTVIARPGMGSYTSATQGATLTAQSDAPSPSGADMGAATGADAAAAQPASEPLAETTASAQSDAPALSGADMGAATGADAAAAQPASEPLAETTASAQSDAPAPSGADTGADAAAAQPAHNDGSTAIAATADAGGLPLLTLPSQNGVQPDRVLTLRFPIAQNADGAALDVSALTGAELEPIDSLLLTQTLANTPANRAATKAGGQALAYRDTLYLFTRGADNSPFALTSITQEGQTLVCRITVRGSALRAGFYRLRLKADVTGDQVTWETVPWIDGEQSVSATVTEAEVFAWETFTAAITRYDRDAKGLQRMFQHAWGPYTEKPYHGLRVPDFPPVYRSVGLSELVGQVRAAAASRQSPLIRYSFAVRVEAP